MQRELLADTSSTNFTGVLEKFKVLCLNLTIGEICATFYDKNRGDGLKNASNVISGTSICYGAVVLTTWSKQIDFSDSTLSTEISVSFSCLSSC